MSPGLFSLCQVPDTGMYCYQVHVCRTYYDIYYLFFQKWVSVLFRTYHSTDQMPDGPTATRQALHLPAPLHTVD
jgi:hypothetical protein